MLTVPNFDTVRKFPFRFAFFLGFLKHAKMVKLVMQTKTHTITLNSKGYKIRPAQTLETFIFFFGSLRQDNELRQQQDRQP